MGDTPLLEVGRIGRAHGLRGEVTVSLSTDRTERVEPGSVLHAGDRRLTVLAARPHQGRWIVAFDGVADRTAAEALNGNVLRAEAIAVPDALWVHDLVGAEVVTADGRDCGRVTEVIENPAHDLLHLDSGRLVPVVFVVDESGLPDRLVIDPPPGLVDDDGV